VSKTVANRSNLRSSIRSIIRGQAVALVTGAATLMAPAVVGITGMAVSGVAAAQDYTSGVLTGRVVGIDGKAVGGADVTVVSQQGQTRKTTTDESGAFKVPALAAGSYTVTVEKAGIGTQVSRATVAPGGSSYEFVLGQEMESVVVTAEAIRDVTSTDTGLAVEVQELANQIPVGRNINAITQLTPGASLPDPTINASSRRNQSLSSIAGTSAAESAYYINGLNVTDQRTFLGYADLPFEFLQTVETKTGGYSAEYGRGTGGVVNMVTRSGTNEWEFGASVAYAPDSLREQSPTAYAPGGTGSAGQVLFNGESEIDSTTYTVSVGGPIIKDRLFIFGIYEGRDYESWGAPTFSTPTTLTGQQTNTQYDDPFWGAKIDLVITDDHLLEGTVWSDETTTAYQPWVVTRPAGDSSDLTRTEKSPAYESDSGGINYILKYTGAFTEWFTLSALYGKLESSYLDSGEAVNLPAVLDFGAPGGAAYVNNRRFGLYNLRGKDERDTYRIDMDFYFNAAGEHRMRVGYDQEDLTSDAYSAYNGGALYYAGGQDYGSDEQGYVEILTFANNGVFKAEQTAAYIQDSWQITDSFNLQLGVRWDMYDYQNLDGESYVKIDDQYAPRIGFTWDPFGNGLDRVYGSIGDYYLPIATNTSIRASSGEIYTDDYFNAVRDVDGNLVLDENGYPVLGPRLLDTIYYSPPAVPDPASVAEKGLNPMYEREFSLGYEHTFETGFAEGWIAGARVVYRDLKSTIEDTAIGDAMVRWCERTGTECGQTGPDDSAFSSYFPYVLINPGDAASVYLDITGQPRANADGTPNPDYNPQWVDLTVEDLALPKAEREYTALELTFERPFDGKWGLRGSYVWAESEGNYEGAVKSDIGQTDTSITQDFDHAANSIGAYGILPNSRAHTFKLFGNYAFNDSFSMGTNLFAQSGRKYGCIGYVPLDVDPLAPQSGTPSGWYCPNGDDTSTLVGRGKAGETDWVYQVDLNFVWNVIERETGTFVLRADVFNLFDFDAVTRVVESGEIRNRPGQVAAFYEEPRSYQAPRSIRLTASYNF